MPLLETESPIANVVTVAKQGGDFVSIAQALDSIVGASTSNQYLVQIGPGEYITNRTLHIKPGVAVVGSGGGTAMVGVGVAGSAAVGLAVGGGTATGALLVVALVVAWDGAVVGVRK